jgi:hypothetical protein
MTQINPFIETQNMEKMAKKTQNTYGKLEDFASHTDTLEEIHENREQIEISKFYEKLPHPTILATKEFQDDQLSYRYND